METETATETITSRMVRLLREARERGDYPRRFVIGSRDVAEFMREVRQHPFYKVFDGGLPHRAGWPIGAFRNVEVFLGAEIAERWGDTSRLECFRALVCEPF
jgi:hypothetical protein